MMGLGKGFSEGRGCVSQAFWAFLPSLSRAGQARPLLADFAFSPTGGPGRCRQGGTFRVLLIWPGPALASVSQSSQHVGWAGERRGLPRKTPAWAGRRARRCHVLSAANLLRVLGAEDPEACLDSSWAMPVLPASSLGGPEFVALPRGAMRDVSALSTLARAQALPVHMFTIQNPGPGPRKRGSVPHPPRAPVKHWTWNVTGPEGWL